jgi:hypothetical protein
MEHLIVMPTGTMHPPQGCIALCEESGTADRILLASSNTKCLFQESQCIVLALIEGLLIFVRTAHGPTSGP